jgi:hypothetical protein
MTNVGFWHFWQLPRWWFFQNQNQCLKTGAKSVKSKKCHFWHFWQLLSERNLTVEKRPQTAVPKCQKPHDDRRLPSLR